MWIAPFSKVGSSTVVLMVMDTISIGPMTPVPTMKVVLSRSSSRIRCPKNIQKYFTQLDNLSRQINHLCLEIKMQNLTNCIR